MTKALEGANVKSSAIFEDGRRVRFKCRRLQRRETFPGKETVDRYVFPASGEKTIRPLDGSLGSSAAFLLPWLRSSSHELPRRARREVDSTTRAGVGGATVSHTQPCRIRPRVVPRGRIAGGQRSDGSPLQGRGQQPSRESRHALVA